MSSYHPPLHRIPPLKVIAASLLAVLLAWVTFLTYQYYTTRKPIAELPGLPGVAQVMPRTPPRYLEGLYGPPGSVLAKPLGVAVSAKGERLYVTQATGERDTVVLDRAGAVVGRLVPPGTVPADRMPLYVAVDPQGAVYVSDRLRAVIDIYAPNGDYRGTFQPPADWPAAPMALTFDQQGNLYVTDLAEKQHRVLVYDPAGALRLKFGTEGHEPGEFSFPNGIAVDQKGTIYVADSNNARVQIFNSGGRLVDVIGRGGRGQLGMPRGVAVDDLGRLFIADMTNSSVEVWDTAGEPRKLYGFGGEGVGDGQLSYPNGLALDSTGRVYVADRANNRLQVWTY